MVADQAKIYTVIYDVDNNGVVNSGDFGVFSAAYRGTVGSPEDPVTGPFYTWADFDGNGRVNSGDFGYLSAVYRMRDSQIDFSQLPPNYRPANWVSGASVRATLFPADLPTWIPSLCRLPVPVLARQRQRFRRRPPLSRPRLFCHPL